MNTQRRLVLLETSEGINIEQILNKHGIKILENEAITNGKLMKVNNFFENELRQEYLLNQVWYQNPDTEKNPMLLAITEETYRKEG